MTPEEWLALSPLLDELLELAPDERRTRLARIAQTNAEQAEELERLLALEDATPDFMARPVVEGIQIAPCEGDHIGPYRLERLVGEGGMGQVWQASRADGLYERRVALKLLRPGFADPNLRSRFHRERQILARLGHANIARLLDAGTSDDGRPYLAIEFINGEPITEYAQRLGLDTLARLRLFVQVCGAVSHAHANLVVHRDLKPSNILVTPAGDVRLLDFGIAKLLDAGRAEHTQITRAESRPFTLHYAAPEQIRGEPITTMTDVYALGVVLYELLTGQPPYPLKRDSDAGWEEAILELEPVRPSLAAARDGRRRGPERGRARRLAGDLDNILLKALRKAPEQRYASAEALCQDLLRHLEGRPVSARAHSVPYRLGKFASRHAVAIGTAALVVGLLGSGLGAVHWQARHALHEAQRAQAMQDFVVALFESSVREGGEGTVDLRRLLDDGMRRAESELAGQPLPRAELLGLIARLHNGLGNHVQALEVLDRKARAIGDLGPDAPAALRLGLLVQQTRAHRLGGDLRACSALAVSGDAVAGVGTRDHPLLAELGSQLGRCAEHAGDATQAQLQFERALALRRGRPAEEAESLVDLARLDARAGRPARALQHLQQGMHLARQAGAERSALSTQLWLAKASVQFQLGEITTAEGDARQALEDSLLNFGALHPVTFSVQRQLAVIALERGDVDHARRLLELGLRELDSRYAERRVDRAETRLELARVALARRQPGQASELVQQALTLVPGELGALLRPDAHLLHARALADRGDLRRGLLAIDATLADIESLYGSRHPVRLEARLVRAGILSDLGQHAQARDELAGALEMVDVPMRRHPVAGRARLQWARTLAATGEFDSARGEVGALLSGFPDTEPGRAGVHWHARALEAELDCGQGFVARGQRALEDLEETLDVRGASAGSPWMLVVRDSRRRCEAMADGQAFAALR